MISKVLVFPKEESGNDAKIILEQIKFSKKPTSNSDWSLHPITVVFPMSSTCANFQLLIEGSLIVGASIDFWT